ncbi:hypothetical protein ISS30_04765 [bacterium]|nr:hypothetical protein [FCB group bacterium]MBL7190986.1 hypothetical protein [bacterium]
MSNHSKSGRSIWKVLTYLILLIIPLYFLVNFFLTMLYSNNSLNIVLKGEVMKLVTSQQFHLIKAVSGHIARIEQEVVQFETAGWGLGIKDFVAKNPEVASVYKGVRSGNIPAYLAMLSAEIKSDPDKAQSEADINKFRKVNWDDRWWKKTGRFGGGDKKLQYILLKKGDDWCSIIIDPQKLIDRLPMILFEYEHSEEGFGESFYLQYLVTPGNGFNCRLILSDESGEELFSRGEAKGEAWDWVSDDPQYNPAHMDLSPFMPWTLDVEVYIFGKALKKTLNAASQPQTHKYIALAVSILCIIFLGHFSPHLHGFNRSRND